MPKFGQKGFAHLLLILLLIIGLAGVGLTVYLVQTKTNLFPKASESEIKIEQAKGALGYIIEFKDEPLVEFRNNRDSNIITQFFGQSEGKIKSNHEQAKQDILSRLGSVDIAQSERVDPKIAASLEERIGNTPSGKILGEYVNIFNGMAIDISEQQAQLLSSSPYVKNIYPNRLVKLDLQDSIPLIQANKVWPQADSQGRTVTGRGVNIAILDTGIDFTHPDLGASVITERPMIKINPSPIADNWTPISTDGERVAYGDGPTVKVYSFADGNTKTINLQQPLKRAGHVAVEGNWVTYVTDTNGFVESDDGIYLYNLIDNSSRKITEAISIYNLFVGQGKVVFETYRPENATYVYDIGTNQTKKVRQRLFYETTLAKYDNGKLIWGIYDEEPCIAKAAVYDIATEQQTEYVLDLAGPFLDFKGNKLLYVNSCGASQTLMYHDLVTGQKTAFHIKPPTLTGTPFRGKIEDEVIFAQYSLGGKIMAYNPNQNKLSQINVKYYSDLFDAAHKKVCFQDNSEKNVYCHDYNPSYDYPLPNIYNNKVKGGYDFVLNNTDARDDYGHGTHVAATAAGNGVLKGVAPDANLYSYKVFDSGFGNDSWIMSAIEYGVKTLLDTNPDNNIDIMNLSLGAWCSYGYYNPSCGPDDPLSRSVDNAASTGIIMVVAAGNSGPDPKTINTPGTARKAITVGAVDKNKRIAYFSGRGPINLNGEIINKPDVVAPGVSICAAKSNIYMYSDPPCIDNNHVPLSGTSMATPHVAGLVALLKQYNYSLTPSEVKDILKTSAVNLNLPVDIQGAGLVDAFAAFKKLNPGATFPPATACNPRPNIGRSSQMTSTGMLVTLTAGTNSNTPTNPMKEIAFTKLDNGSITINRSYNTSSFSYAVPENTNTVSFLIRQLAYGQPTTISLSVKDSCGNYPLFFGGGISAGWPK